MSYEFDFSKLTIPVARWQIMWKQRIDDGVELWVGTETQSCLIGVVGAAYEADEAMQELRSMREAAKMLGAKE